MNSDVSDPTSFNTCHMLHVLRFCRDVTVGSYSEADPCEYISHHKRSALVGFCFFR